MNGELEKQFSNRTPVKSLADRVSAYMDSSVSLSINSHRRVTGGGPANRFLRNELKMDELVEGGILSHSTNNQQKSSLSHHQYLDHFPNMERSNNFHGTAPLDEPLSHVPTSGIALESSSINHFQKQQIRYMLSDHLVTRPGPIDLLSDQILCPDLNISPQLMGGCLSTYNNEGSRKPKKYSFHEVTPEQIKTSNRSSIKTYRPKPLGVSAPGGQGSSRPNANYRRLVEQQTIYLNYEVARRNAIIARLKKGGVDSFSELQRLFQQNQQSPHAYSINERNSNTDFTDNTSFTFATNDNSSCYRDENTSTDCIPYDDGCSTFSDNVLFSGAAANGKLLACSVDDYLRTFDISVPVNGNTENTDEVNAHMIPETDHSTPASIFGEFSRNGQAAEYVAHDVTHQIRQFYIDCSSSINSSAPNNRFCPSQLSANNYENMHIHLCSLQSETSKQSNCNNVETEAIRGQNTPKVATGNLVAFYELLADLNRNRIK